MLKNHFFTSNFVCAAKDSYEGGYALSEMPIEGSGDRCSFRWSVLLYILILCYFMPLLIIFINFNKNNHKAAAFYYC